MYITRKKESTHFGLELSKHFVLKFSPKNINDIYMFYSLLYSFLTVNKLKKHMKLIVFKVEFLRKKFFDTSKSYTVDTQ